MNDCFWYGIFACEGRCIGCKKYTDINSEGGIALSKVYNADIEEALLPVKNVYKRMFEILYGD